MAYSSYKYIHSLSVFPEILLMMFCYLNEGDFGKSLKVRDSCQVNATCDKYKEGNIGRTFHDIEAKSIFNKETALTKQVKEKK